MIFIYLLAGKLHKKQEKRKLKHFRTGCARGFYRNVADNIDNFRGSDYYGKIENDTDIPTKDV